MADKIDFKKEYKDLYLPKAKPVLISVPAIPFIYCDGSGAPEDADYQNGIAVLYALSYTIKMSKMGGNTPDGYFDYTVPPLEGLWSGAPSQLPEDRALWKFTSMIRQPDFVTQAVFEWALAEAARKKPEVDFAPARYGVWEEGLCAQVMHRGPYADEPQTLALLAAFVAESGHVEDVAPAVTGLSRRHHEIYLSDPRKTKPENMKTVLRCPVRPTV